MGVNLIDSAEYACLKEALLNVVRKARQTLLPLACNNFASPMQCSSLATAPEGMHFPVGL